MLRYSLFNPPRPSRSSRLALLEPSLQALVRQTRELELPAELVLRRLTTLLGDEP
jgi:GntR family transcriptional regulator